jgi:hypothetical protein
MQLLTVALVFFRVIANAAVGGNVPMEDKNLNEDIAKKFVHLVFNVSMSDISVQEKKRGKV